MNVESDMMEEIMLLLNDHLKPTIGFGEPPNVHHYNRAWEKIAVWHDRHVGEYVGGHGDESKLESHGLEFVLLRAKRLPK